MRYLLSYQYNGIQNGYHITGQGSVRMTITGTDKITEQVIDGSLEWIKNDLLKNQGFSEVFTIAAMGWYRFDEEREVTE